MLLNAEINAKESEIADLNGQLQAAQERWDAVQPDLAELARLRAIVKVLIRLLLLAASARLTHSHRPDVTFPPFNPCVVIPTPRHHNYFFCLGGHHHQPCRQPPRFARV